LPFSYAIQNTTAETPIVETSLFEDEKITIIKIKAKTNPLIR
jgi:hypothetical protein